MHMSHEDQPGERTLGDSQDEASLFPLPTTVHNSYQRAPVTLPGAATHPDAPTEAFPTNAAFPSPAGENPDALAGVDPFALWAATSGKPPTSPPAPEPSTRRPSGHQTKSDPRTRTRPTQQSRRNLIKLLAVGATGLVTVVTVGGISFARSAQSPTQARGTMGMGEEHGRIRRRLHSPRRDRRLLQRNRRNHRRPRRQR